LSLAIRFPLSSPHTPAMTIQVRLFCWKPRSWTRISWTIYCRSIQT